jgi:glycosyltransferase involved in cell wall biosynthesis
MKKILFHDNGLNLRGTSVALYNYADYNEKILGNKSIIISNPNGDLSALNKFKERFETYLLPFSEYDLFCQKNKIDYFYIIKAGANDGLLLNNVKTLVHNVFLYNQPHGHKYFYVSDWLANEMGYNPKTHSLPHIVTKPNFNDILLRNKLGIGKNKTVFGYLGGPTQFDIKFVQNKVEEIARQNKDIFFIFMNVLPFCENIENIIFLHGTWDLDYKYSFISACDAMLHARSNGETFGYSIAEFSMLNKPVITYKNVPEKSHIDILKEKGIYYENIEELHDILLNLKKFIRYDDYNKIYCDFSPEIIMDKFNNVFLN